MVGPVKGRGTSLDPANRFEGIRLEVLPEAEAEMQREHPGGVQVGTRVYRDATRRIINRVDSPDVSFKWTINPYRGCEVGCSYCYARPTHETLGFSCGLDFETKIVAKPDAPKLLRRELASPRWAGEPIVMAAVTDCYQPLEMKLGITRKCLEVMTEFNQPVSIITKRRLVVRDRDLLSKLARVSGFWRSRGLALNVDAICREADRIVWQERAFVQFAADHLLAYGSLTGERLAAVAARIPTRPLVRARGSRSPSSTSTCSRC